MFCPKCGSENEATSGFCGSCGASLKKDTTAVTSAKGGTEGVGATAGAAVAVVPTEAMQESIKKSNKIIAIILAIVIILIAFAACSGFQLFGKTNSVAIYRPSLIKKVDASGNTEGITEFKYDEKGKLLNTTSKTMYKNGDIDEYSRSYKWNSDDSYLLYDEDDEFLSTSKYSLNMLGLVDKCTSFNPEGDEMQLETSTYREDNTFEEYSMDAISSQGKIGESEYKHWVKESFNDLGLAVYYNSVLKSNDESNILIWSEFQISYTSVNDKNLPIKALVNYKSNNEWLGERIDVSCDYDKDGNLTTIKAEPSHSSDAYTIEINGYQKFENPSPIAIYQQSLQFTDLFLLT